MNSSFIPSTVASSTTPSALEPSVNPEVDPPPAPDSHHLEDATVSAVASIEKLEHDVVSAVEADLAQSATPSSPKRPRANDTSPVVIHTINEVVGTSELANGVEHMEPEPSEIANHVRMPSIEMPSAAETDDGQGVPDGRTLQLETAVHTVALTVDPTIVHQQNSLSDLMPAASTAQAIVNSSDLNSEPQPPAKKKRKTYNTEEERRQARILKNRRTAEESRQRRLKRMKELEEIAAKAETRERELLDEVQQAKEQLQEAAKVETSLRAALQQKETEITRRDSELARREAELLQKHEEVERLHEKLTLK
ncbi:Basic-leucine zipper [Gracilaria domingensis]|nr:Basic-leucine zipper [Gracilaria domingensis]